MQYRLSTLRKITVPLATAGEAQNISLSEFFPSTLNFGPA
jgi:hypothetical protein